MVPPSSTISKSCQVSNATLESKQIDSKKKHVKRPMNAYLIWCRDARQLLSKSWKPNSARETSKILGKVWGQLANEQKKVYFEEAERIKKEHKLENPNYKFQPKRRMKLVATLTSTQGEQAISEETIQQARSTNDSRVQSSQVMEQQKTLLYGNTQTFQANNTGYPYDYSPSNASPTSSSPFVFESSSRTSLSSASDPFSNRNLANFDHSGIYLPTTSYSINKYGKNLI